MKLVSWNCQRGLITKEKYKKLIELSPDIAVLQDGGNPDDLREYVDFQSVLWESEDKSHDLCVISFNKDYSFEKLEMDTNKYKWILPIKVTGKFNFILIAVWLKRIQGSSYGKQFYSFLKEYESLLSNENVVMIGDFNIDKNIPGSFSGIQGSKGFNLIIDLLSSYGFQSCYHYFTNEEYGAESKATYHHQRNKEKPFHIDYCFTKRDVLQDTETFHIDQSDEQNELSGHYPLVLEFELGTFEDINDKPVTPDLSTMKEEKEIITPEMLKEKYVLKIGDQIASNEEIDEAIRYIKAIRLMKNLDNN